MNKVFTVWQIISDCMKCSLCVYCFFTSNNMMTYSRETSCVMDMDDCKLGFTHLRLVQCNHAYILEWCKQIGHSSYLSNELLKSELISRSQQFSISSFLDPLHPIGTKSIPWFIILDFNSLLGQEVLGLVTHLWAGNIHCLEWKHSAWSMRTLIRYDLIREKRLVLWIWTTVNLGLLIFDWFNVTTLIF
jgi:hypothetical protein